ncbi:MAG: type II toxin-antitoxin system RelE/ParE family toxin [Defluviitaleaceae bacterium]|nr:type II toxin-antitoxin system RelE/ParE family toxin [Defluviitaleaceae bacterium]
MIWDVQFSDMAKKDLRGIRKYISDELLEPETALEQVARIISAADSLEFMPMRHRICDFEPWHSRGLRLLPVDNYTVYYLPNESFGTVNVIRVVYNGRNIAAVFMGDSNAQ